MGKGARKRSARVEERIKEQEIKKRQDKERKHRRIFRITVTAFVALLVCAAVAFSTLAADGFFLRNTVSITSTSYKVDNAMMSYFFHQQYNSYVNAYSSYLSYMGLDTSKSLKDQSYGEDQTWFDYFMSTAKNTVKETVLVAEAAKEAGVTLDEKDKATIDKYFESLKSTAKDNGVGYQNYLSAQYGKGVKESDIRKCMELSTLFSKYKKQIYNGLVYSDTDIQAYYAGNSNQFQYFDYKSYTFESVIPEGSTEDQTKTINAETKKKADDLAACKTSEAFDSYLTSYLKTLKDTDQTKIPETVKGTLHEGSTYTKDNELSEWAFDKTRTAGDTTVMEGTNQYTVYLLVKVPYRYEYITKNIRHILLTSSTYGSDAKTKTKAEELKQEWLKGDKTAKSFGDLANQYSEDSGSNTTGGLYENVKEGQMIDQFDAWSYDDKRKSGDIDIISTDYGVHVIYFESNGLEAWKAEVIDAMQNADYEAQKTIYEKKYTITVDDTKLNSIKA